MNSAQTELPLFQVDEADPNIPFLQSILYERDWTTAGEIIQLVVLRTEVRWCERKVRALAAASKGEVASGQRGYKLVRHMTADEYNHFRNWMTSQAEEMRKRVVESDKVFYGRKPVVI